MDDKSLFEAVEEIRRYSIWSSKEREVVPEKHEVKKLPSERVHTRRVPILKKRESKQTKPKKSVTFLNKLAK